ncbi:hypothetical protein KUT61_26915 [Pseudomonas aeruginosa]|nr:hypothetical protein [Pseudomonas aeruginosa]
MCRRVNRAAALYCRSKKHFITGVALMVTATGVAHAANTVDSRFTNTVVTGDGNSVTGNRDTHFSGNTESSVENMADRALENSINIPPTAYILPGTVMTVVVARDIDFSTVFENR